MSAPKNYINFNYIFNLTLSALLAIFSWNAVRLIDSVDELSKMVYQHEIQIIDQSRRIDKIESKIIANYQLPINNIPAKDNTNVYIFNKEICSISNSKPKKKYFNV